MRGERLLWQGRPASGIVFTSADLFAIPFSAVWLGFVIFWLTAARAGGAPPFFLLFGGMFLVIGLFMAFGRFVADAWLRRRTSYGVTDRRVLIERAGPFGAFTSIDVERVPEINLVGEGRERGTLRFGPTVSAFSNKNASGWLPSLDGTAQFIAIEKPRDVLALILKTRNAAGARRQPRIGDQDFTRT